MCKASYSRKKMEDEMLTARHVEVDAQLQSYYTEGKDPGKAKLIMVRVCLRVNKSRSSKKVSQQN